MARRNTEIDEEKKSRSVLFLLARLPLLVTGIWAVVERQHLAPSVEALPDEFRNLEYQRAQDALAAEQARLEADPQYQELQTQLVAARQSLTEGETAKQIADARAADAASSTSASRSSTSISASSRASSRRPGTSSTTPASSASAEEPKRATIDELEAHRVETQKSFDDAASHQRAQLESEIKELQAGVKTIEDKIADVAAERFKLEQKLDALVVLHVGPVRMLAGSEDRADGARGVRPQRLQPAGRARRPLHLVPRRHRQAGLRGPAESLQDTPRSRAAARQASAREVRLHAVPRRAGRGASTASSRRTATFRSGSTRCSAARRCRRAAASATWTSRGCSTPSRSRPGEKLFEQLGCHGCHLVEGLRGLAKVRPVPAAHRRQGRSVVARPLGDEPARVPRRARRCRTSSSRQEQGTAVAAYLLKASAKESEEWLAHAPPPAGIDPANADAGGARQGAHRADRLPRLPRASRPTRSQAAARRRQGHRAEPREHRREDRRPLDLPLDQEPARLLAGVAHAEPAADATRTRRRSRPICSRSARRSPSRRNGSAALGRPENDRRGREAGAQVRLRRLPRHPRHGERIAHRRRALDLRREDARGALLRRTLRHPADLGRLDLPQDQDARAPTRPSASSSSCRSSISPDEDIKALRVFLTSRTEHMVPATYRYKPNDQAQKHIVEGERLVAQLQLHRLPRRSRDAAASSARSTRRTRRSRRRSYSARAPRCSPTGSSAS